MKYGRWLKENIFRVFLEPANGFYLQIKKTWWRFIAVVKSINDVNNAKLNEYPVQVVEVITNTFGCHDSRTMAHNMTLDTNGLWIIS